MRILMVTSFYPPYHVGGAGMHVYYLANSLARRGHEIHILYSIDSYYLIRRKKPDTKRYQNHENVHLHPIRTPIRKLTPLTTYMTGTIPFIKSIRKVLDQNFDVIHYHNISLFGPKILSLGKAKKIYTAHDHWLICPYNDFFRDNMICTRKPSPITCSMCLLKHNRPPQLWRFSDKLKDGLKNIDVFISPSQYLKGFYERFNIGKEWKVLPNYVPCTGDDHRGNAIQDTEAGDIAKPFFFYAGMLESIKGIMPLLEAFRTMPEEILVIAGKGSLENKMLDFIRKNHLQRRIIYAGFLSKDKIYEYYKNAQAFILGSFCPENAPLSILESLSVGTPAIGSDVGGIPEIISKVDKNLIFDNLDKESLKKAIFRVKEKQYDKNDKNKERIISIFKRYFSEEAYIKKYEKIIKEIT